MLWKLQVPSLFIILTEEIGEHLKRDSLKSAIKANLPLEQKEEL